MDCSALWVANNQTLRSPALLESQIILANVVCSPVSVLGTKYYSWIFCTYLKSIIKEDFSWLVVVAEMIQQFLDFVDTLKVNTKELFETVKQKKYFLSLFHDLSKLNLLMVVRF